MRELEVKFKVKNTDTLLTKLRNDGYSITSPVIQKDVIFLPKTKETYVINEGDIVVRIRQENNAKTAILTLKKQLKEKLHSLEYEVDISDPLVMAQILSELGLKEFVRVEKIRYKTKINEYNLCIDTVSELGYFVEVEYLYEAGIEFDISTRKTLMSELLKKYGVEIEMSVTTPYDTQIYLLHHKPSI